MFVQGQDLVTGGGFSAAVAGDASGQTPPDGTVVTGAGFNASVSAQDNSDHSGLSQGMRSMDVSPIVSTPPRQGPPGLSQPLMSINTNKDEIISRFIEDEILTHLPLVLAQDQGVNHIGVRFPECWPDLKVILDKLGYSLEAVDHWQTLGMAMMEGPEPTLLSITNRKATAQWLCALAKESSWSTGDFNAAMEAKVKVGKAAQTCEDTLSEVIAMRRRQKASKLPLHKELGTQAFKFVQALAPTSKMATQWSDILRLQLVDENAVTWSRKIANLAEKGDDKLWREIKGQDVILWAPGDNNSLTRLLSQYLKLTTADQRPVSLCLLVPIPLSTGMGSVENILDLWHTPLLSDKWTSIVQRVSFTSTPMEMVLPGGVTPRHGRFGLGIFQLDMRAWIRSPPVIIEPADSLVVVADPKVVHLDCRALDLPKMMTILDAPELKDILCRAPARSPLSSKKIPRITLQWILPEHLSYMEVILFLRSIRGQSLPADTFYGVKDMFSDKDSLILEFTSEMAVPHYWSLSSQLIPIGPRNSLIYTDTAAEIWTSRMDVVMKEDMMETSVKLRWRASKLSGRTFAAPTATTQALAASRRRGTSTAVAFHNYNAEVEVMGEIGREDGQVMNLLMTHVVNLTGIQLVETDYGRDPKAGEFIHLATQDSTAKPGMLRVILKSSDEVRKLFNALDGQTVQVGQDKLGVRVLNDLVQGCQVPGNEKRSWK